MKTKLILTAFATAIFSFGAWAGGNATVDTELSTVRWEAKKVGGAHDGVVKITNGNLTFSGHNLTGGSIEIDMTSIACTDIADEKMNAKFVGHLHSADFFSTEEFPTATFVATDVQVTGNHKFSVTGDLTIKGITAPVTFDATVSHERETLVTRADIVVDRTVYDVRYGSKKFFDNLGDKFIYDNFTLSVELLNSIDK